MSDNDSMKTPLIDNLRAAPVDLRCEWAFQWAEDGSAIGHARAPVGKLCHEAADEIEALQCRVDGLEKAIKAVQCLIDESDGVCGLHLNGDVAMWRSLLEGGQFEPWLIEFSTAINSTKEMKNAKL